MRMEIAKEYLKDEIVGSFNLGVEMVT